MAAGDGFELEVYDDELGRYVRVPAPSAKPLAVRKKKAARAKEPSAGDYLATLGDVLFVNPRNSAAATLGGAAYDYAVKSTPRSVVRDITESAEDAGDWLRKEGKLIRAAPVTESLRLLKAGFIDPLADPYRVFKQAATERARGNETGGKKLAAMVPLAVAGVLPQGRGASKVATKAGVEAATKKATKKATKTAAKPQPTRAYTPEEQAVYERFGSKQQKEATRQSKVTTGAGTGSRRRVSGIKGKTSPTVYRDLQAKEGPEAVLSAGNKGEHLKRTESGYVGFPRTVENPSGLGAMRRGLDEQVQEASDAIRLADPTNLGNWYNRARAGMAESTEPYQLPRVLEQHGVYSAGVSPESELGFALKHLNSRAIGEPGMAFRGAGQETLDNAVAENRLAELGDKTGIYMTKQDPRIPGEGLFGVNDFRWAQSMGYTDPQGKPWKAAVSSTMHPVMDMETGLMTQRANERAMGGRTDWLGEQMQEIPWVYGKAQDLYSRGNSPTGRFGGEPIEGMKAALLEANKTPADYFPKHILSGTYEMTPGASTRHMSDVIGMTPEEKIAYGRQGAWAQPSPERRAMELGMIDIPESVGAGDRDVLYSAAGMRQLPTIESSGAYQNMAGEWEYNPLNIARPLVDYPTGGGAEIAPLTKNAVTALERFRAVNDAQEAGAANLPNTLRSLSGKNAVLLDTGAKAAQAGTQPTSEQLRALIEGLGEGASKFGVTATNRGAYVFPYDPGESSAALRALDLKRLEDLLPGSTAIKSGGTGVYVPGIGKWGDEGIEPTTPYSGEATMGLLEEFAKNPQELALNVGESEGVRAQLREKYLRDLNRRNELGSDYRGDIQNTRRFFSEADWPKAVELIRKGLSPAAAIAALGYSSTAMAEEKE